jgi:hypothetical protein
MEKYLPDLTCSLCSLVSNLTIFIFGIFSPISLSACKAFVEVELENKISLG